MEITEARELCKELWALTEKIWKSSGKAKAAATAEWRALHDKIEDGGFKIYRKRIRNGNSPSVIEYTPSPRKQGADCIFYRFNANPTGERLPDCTTRALAYVLKDTTYFDIKAEQLKLALTYNDTWNSRSVWPRVLTKRGWSRICLDRHVTAASCAKIFKAFRHDIVVSSSGHVAVLSDRGQGLGVVDTWDSRGKRVKEIMVEKDYVGGITEKLEEYKIKFTIKS